MDPGYPSDRKKAIVFMGGGLTRSPIMSAWKVAAKIAIVITLPDTRR